MAYILISLHFVDAAASAIHVNWSSAWQPQSAEVAADKV